MANHSSSNQGGKRISAGRKPAPYKTQIVAFRIRTDWAEAVKNAVLDKLAQLKSQ